MTQAAFLLKMTDLGEACAFLVAGGVVDVDVFMRTVEVTAADNRLALAQLGDVVGKCEVPLLDAVVQALEPSPCVGCVDIDEVKCCEFGRDGAPLLIELRRPNAKGNAHRLGPA